MVAIYRSILYVGSAVRASRMILWRFQTRWVRTVDFPLQNEPSFHKDPLNPFACRPVSLTHQNPLSKAAGSQEISGLEPTKHQKIFDPTTVLPAFYQKQQTPPCFLVGKGNVFLGLDGFNGRDQPRLQAYGFLESGSSI